MGTMEGGVGGMEGGRGVDAEGTRAEEEDREATRTAEVGRRRSRRMEEGVEGTRAHRRLAGATPTRDTARARRRRKAEGATEDTARVLRRRRRLSQPMEGTEGTEEELLPEARHQRSRRMEDTAGMEERLLLRRRGSRDSARRRVDTGRRSFRASLSREGRVLEGTVGERRRRRSRDTAGMEGTEQQGGSRGVEEGDTERSVSEVAGVCLVAWCGDSAKLCHLGLSCTVVCL